MAHAVSVRGNLNVCQYRVQLCLRLSRKSLAIKVRGSTWSRPTITSPWNTCECIHTHYLIIPCVNYLTNTEQWNHQDTFMKSSVKVGTSLVKQLHVGWSVDIGTVCRLYFDIEFNLDVNPHTPPIPVLDTFIDVCWSKLLTLGVQCYLLHSMCATNWMWASNWGVIVVMLLIWTQVARKSFHAIWSSTYLMLYSLTTFKLVCMVSQTPSCDHQRVSCMQVTGFIIFVISSGV